jgi:hypothetical protein
MEISNGILIEKNALSVELCKDIIEIFESNNKKNDANVLGGVFKDVLNAKTIYCTDINHPNWPRIEKFIEKITITTVFKYIRKMGEVVKCKQPDFDLFTSFNWKGFSINKYSADESGHYIYHTDRHIILETDEERIITFIYYLQDVEIGGETDFPSQGITVKPESGKLVLFPSTWTYPHCSLPTISNDKYIMVGWILAKNYRKGDNLINDPEKNPDYIKPLDTC